VGVRVDRKKIGDAPRRLSFGKDMSAYSIEDYTVIKHVMARLG
jgi:hypothetical protein